MLKQIFALVKAIMNIQVIRTVSSEAPCLKFPPTDPHLKLPFSYVSAPAIRCL